jgi:hypothetical protein
VAEEKHGGPGRILLQRAEAIAVVCGVLVRAVRADLRRRRSARRHAGRSSSVGWTGTRSFLDSSPSCVAQSTWSG